MKKALLAFALVVFMTVLASARSTNAWAKQVIVDDRSTVNGSITIEVRRPNLRCDGKDSTNIVITRRRSDGSPAAGDLQPIYVDSGSYTVLNAEPGPYGYLPYDERGQLRLRVTPTNNARGYWGLTVSAYPGERGGHHSFSCPFTTDLTHTITGDVWNDRNADGLQATRERSLKGFDIGIQCAACWYFWSVPWHPQNTDRSGRFEWIGLPGGGYGPLPWQVCLDDRQARRWSIVSVNGIPIERSRCVSFAIVQPGNQNFSLGVARN